jgi:hypothetical protein
MIEFKEEGYLLKTTLTLLLLIACSSVVAFGNSVSTMITAPDRISAYTEQSVLFIDIYDSYHVINGKLPVYAGSNSLSASYQQGSNTILVPISDFGGRTAQGGDGGDPPDPGPNFPSAIPEPGTLLLGVLGLAVIGLVLPKRI